MLRRWDDSQKYLSDNPHLVCEETANYLVIMCIDLEVEEVNSLFFAPSALVLQDCVKFFSLIKIKILNDVSYLECHFDLLPFCLQLFPLSSDESICNIPNVLSLFCRNTH